jgi:hypothetical protein
MASSGGRARPERSRSRWLGSFDQLQYKRTAEQQMSFAERADSQVFVSLALFFAAFEFQIQPGNGFRHRAECRRSWGLCAAGLRCANRENQGG